MPDRTFLRERLRAARHDLLDLGLRNPLLNYRTLKARGLDVVDELPEQVLRLLAHDGRAFSFLPAPERASANPADAEMPPGEVAALLAQPEDEDNGTAARHTDTRLQTPYSSVVLQNRLLSTYYAARTVVEEQGVNVLYLALGMLEWYEDASSTQMRRAPLVLVPVELSRRDVRARFHLRYTGEDIGGNLSLQARLKASFGVTLPLPEMDDLDLPAYFADVREVVSGFERWRVDATAIHLGFFLFGKLLMHVDLDEGSWPAGLSPLDHPMLHALLGGGFEPAGEMLDEDTFLDEHLHPDEVHQVVDADSSQSLAMLDVKQGHSLVIQGPPGTGKSQTITNIIAEAIGQGRTVLFVAEKMAALEVVKRRLDAVHLGDACLELHSHKTNKRDVLAELQRTLQLGAPQSDALSASSDVLLDARAQLNAYAAAVNTPIGSSGVTPYLAYGFLLRQQPRWAEIEPPAHADGEMTTWTAQDYDRRRALVTRMQSLVQRIGQVDRHPFWGSTRRSFLPTETAAVRAAAQQLEAATEQLAAATAVLSGPLGMDAGTPEAAERLITVAERALEAPDLDGVKIAVSAWRSRKADLDALLAAGAAHEAVQQRYRDTFIPQAWTQDVLGIRQQLAVHGHQWHRFLSGDWRRARAQLAALLAGPLPKSNDERIALVDAILEAQRQRSEVEAREALGTSLFGTRWQGLLSDWTALTSLARWMHDLHADTAAGDLARDVLTVLERSVDVLRLAPHIHAARHAMTQWNAALADAVDLLEMRPSRRFGAEGSFARVPLDELSATAAAWAAETPRLQEMVTFNHEAEALADDGLILLLGLATSWPHAATHLRDAFEYVWHATLLDHATRERPALAQFNGALQADARRRFVDRDVHALHASRARLAYRHWQNLPRSGTAGGANGQLGVLHREFAKKRRHLPIRRLMQEAGHAIQAIKPVFMMSPMSIAAYLPPGAVQFDLVVFDEASQVKPVDALGALLRGRQAVVVGDSRQLPPTSFFDTMIGEAEEEDAAATSDLESILELFKAQQAPERMLRWHYRSRHESLIAVSNREFYDGRLVTFPSPDSEAGSAGLVYRHLPEARYDRGGRRTNRDEARAVAEAVMEHAWQCPDESLLVATFSQAQQREVWDQIELLRRQQHDLDAFFDPDRYEPFDVKNLENVQGDERDVVFISVGYGRDAQGNVSMNFGPLNQEGGERRLNVLITRARLRCEVFTNLHADDLRETDARGVAAFKRFLQYAETGQIEAHPPADAEAEPLFEGVVARALRDLGYEVDVHVGVGRYRVDLAVRHPDLPGRYALGIECDGASYHSARTARDRDRIRQSVLEGLGWRLYRVWSTDWFRAPEAELGRLKSAIEQAIANPDHSAPAPAQRPAPVMSRSGEEAPAPEEQVTPYVTATLRRHVLPLHEVPASTLASNFVQIVRVESPVHIEDAMRRILDAAGVARLGSRIRGALEAALAWAVRGGEIARRGDFLYLKDQRLAGVQVRERSELPASSRSFERIAPEEVQVAIVEVVRASYGIAPDELPLAVCRRFGLGQTSDLIRIRVQYALDDLVNAGIVRQQGDVLTLASLDAADYDGLLM